MLFMSSLKRLFPSTCTNFVIYTYLARYNATYRRFLYVKKLFIQLWKAPLACNVMTTHTSGVRTTSMFIENVYGDVTNFAPFQLLRHVGADKHHFLEYFNIVVPGLIWMRVADMTVYQPGNCLYNLLIKIQICNNSIYCSLREEKNNASESNLYTAIFG